jgi:hypothetical protein
MSNWVAGCDGTESPGEPITVAIASDKAPALVAFRDWLDGSWQAATMKTPTSFEAEVHGPYVITVACEDPAPGNFMISQIARTPDDEHGITLSCDLAAPSTHAVTGHMAQAGTIQIGSEIAVSDTPSWDFALAVPAGTYDLMARTADRIVLRRAIAIAGDVALTSPIDALQEGTALTNVAFSVTNAAPAETLTASVALEQPAPRIPFGVYQGPLATAKLVPDSALAATDKQTAEMLATTAGGYRSLRRPFRAGGSTAYTLPAPLTGVAWEQAGDKLAVRWGALPAFDSFTVSVSEGSTDATKVHGHNLKLSPRFVEATGLTRVDIDTEIAGYKPEWKIDLAGEYQRELFVQHTANGEVATNVVHELVNAPAKSRTPR